MPIEVGCDSCGKAYRVPDERAGTTFKCRGCGEPVDIPAPRRSSRASSRKKSSQNKKLTMLLGGGGVALLGLAALVYVVMSFVTPGGGAGSPASNTVASSDAESGAPGPGASTPAAINQPPELTEAEKAANQAAYDARLAQERGKQADSQRDELARRHGADKVVTVVITGVPGDPTIAEKYLSSKVFRAAFHDYREGEKKAEDATAANRKKAEDEAKANSGGFGIVHYWYKPVYSDLPYPQVIKATSGDGTFTYHAMPVLNPDQFAQRLGIGATTSVDQGKRVVKIKAQLPDPVPDPEVEDMVIQFGKDSVVSVTISGAEGDADRVMYHLESKTATSDPNKTLSIAGMKQIGPGRYSFSVGPVADIQTFASNLKYGSVDSFDNEARTLTMAGSLPTDLPARPTPAELAELRRKEWDKPSIHDKSPKENEDFYVWVNRVVKGNSHFAMEAALKELQIREVDPDKLTEVSALLVSTMKDSSAMQEHLSAMLVWRTPETDKAILGLRGTSHTFHHQKAFINALVGLNTKESARALASGLEDFFAGEETATALIEMGELAEEPVLLHLNSQDAKVRRRAYTILENVGTRKSLSKLKANVGKERDAAMKDLAQFAYDAVKSRVDEQKAGTSAGGDDDPAMKSKSSSSDNPFGDDAKPSKKPPATSDANPFDAKKSGDDENPFDTK